MSDLQWMDRAACRDHDPETWWPIGTTGPAIKYAAEAKRICYACPVLDECRAWALDSLEFGIAGGLTEDERRSLKRRERRRPRSKFAPPMHDPAEVRQLLNEARDAGRTWAEISEAVGGMNEAHLYDIASGRIDGLRDATHERIVAALAGQEVRS